MNIDYYTTMIGNGEYTLETRYCYHGGFATDFGIGHIWDGFMTEKEARKFEEPHTPISNMDAEETLHIHHHKASKRAVSPDGNKLFFLNKKAPDKLITTMGGGGFALVQYYDSSKTNLENLPKICHIWDGFKSEKDATDYYCSDSADILEPANEDIMLDPDWWSDSFKIYQHNPGQRVATLDEAHIIFTHKYYDKLITVVGDGRFTCVQYCKWIDNRDDEREPYIYHIWDGFSTKKDALLYKDKQDITLCNKNHFLHDLNGQNFDSHIFEHPVSLRAVTPDEISVVFVDKYNW